MKQKLLINFLLAIILSLSTPLTALAHSGGTDSRGGHIDHSNGSYHYHHGYPEHHHYDMDDDGIIDCPYLFSYSNDSDSVTESTTEPTEEISLDLSGLESALESMEEYNASREPFPQYVPITTSPVSYPSNNSVSVSNNQATSNATSSSSDGFFIFIGIILIIMAAYILHKNNNH